MKRTVSSQITPTFLALVLGFAATACGGSASDTGDGAASGDGDSVGDSDMVGDGDIAGDGDSMGDGDAAGDGDIAGDGDMMGDGDVTGDGDTVGDGDGTGDGDIGGDGDISGDGDIGGDGDGTVCTSLFAYGLSVTVVGGAVDPGSPAGLVPPPNDGPGNVPAPPQDCFASVVAVDGDYREELICFAGGNDCECMGAGERAGNYTVSAALGDAIEVQDVTVTADECHVQGESLTFFAAK